MRNRTLTGASPLVGGAVASLLLLVGCVTTDAGVVEPRPVEASEPSVGPAPLVEITFEWEGAERTVSGSPDRDFCNTGVSDSFNSTDPLADAGVSVGLDEGTEIMVLAWATADLAVSFQGWSEVHRADTENGTAVWANEVSGEARVTPAETLNGERISQSDLKSLEVVDATASFSMLCTTEAPG